MPKQLYSVPEVANLLGLHVKTVRNYIRSGQLKSTRVGKQYRILKADLEAFAGSALEMPGSANASRFLEVSSIVQIDAVDRASSNRMTNLLMAAAKGHHGKQPMQIDTIYYEQQNRLKVFISGSVESTMAILEMMDHLAGK
ncbi:MAG: helix-turn-helix domain-containing protein [Acidobacteriota bacterium]